MKRKILVALGAALLSVVPTAHATETENLGIRVLPAPGNIAVDGQFNDWDLSGGIFTASDVENQREQYALWTFANYDADNLYLLAHFVDATPLNNPGQTVADPGYAGDSLQVRIITRPGAPNERAAHITAWQGSDGRDLIDITYGRNFDDGGNLPNAGEQGARQAFSVDADRKGYVQEIALPWKLLTKDGAPLRAGETFTMTLEPNFTLGATSRLSLKDLFKPGVTPNRVFTFMAAQVWGPATLEPQGQVAPRPLRLSDAREFPIRLENGVPVVDWTGLMKNEELPGFKTIRFSMPADGYISLNLYDKNGVVARQLLNAAFYSRGEHEVKWDGLTTPGWKKPGEPVAAGEYSWRAITHKGLGLRLRGWAANGGELPWNNGPETNWGGDHGVPSSAASDGKQVYLSWSGAEGGSALVATDGEGKVKWKNSRGGISGVKALDEDGGVLYVLGGLAGVAAEGGSIYKLETATGKYLSWEDNGQADLAIKGLRPDETSEKADDIAAWGGRIYLGIRASNEVLVLDGKTGRLLETLKESSPVALHAANDKLYVLSAGRRVAVHDLKKGGKRYVLDDLNNARALTVDGAGRIYVGLGEPDNRVLVYRDGKLEKTIGRKGGRALLGQWQPDGMRFINDIALDGAGKLWVAEADSYPKRISAWNSATGNLWKEFFGPATYGALGGAISPRDPNLMVGQGCEWQLDPQTGRATCLGVITRGGMENARYGIANGGRVYLAVAPNWAFGVGPLRVFERTGAGQWKLRSTLYHADENGKEIPMPGDGEKSGAARTVLWADKNGDEKRQPDELISSGKGELAFSRWYMPTTQDLTLYSGDQQYKVTGFTPAGAPTYDLANPVEMPAAGFGSADGTLVLQPGEYGGENSLLQAFQIGDGKKLWTYPDTFTGVHGSHNAPPARPGLIRGSFGPTTSVKLPAPIGNAWLIPTNVGEWHVLTEDGFYLASLFQGDPFKIRWPEEAVPGTPMDNVPPGAGGEDFGGSATLAEDGKLYIQSGKTAFWNLEVTGLDTVQALPGQKVAIAPDEVRLAQGLREAQLQTFAGVQRVSIPKMTPNFTGNLDADFGGAEIVSYKKQDDAVVRSAAAWDDQNLYLAWDVTDKTPWQNGADAPEFLYARGDTVDFQIGTNANANAQRGEPGAGDLRLSIGEFNGAPTAVLYRKVAAQKAPKSFSSGVIKDYQMDYVAVVPAEIKVTPRAGGYVVEASIAQEILGLSPQPGLKLRGDFGVTHGDAAGNDTVLRTHWSNQKTGLVNDEVFELMMEPRNWGELNFK